jgi:hypothetical protein
VVGKVQEQWDEEGNYSGLESAEEFGKVEVENCLVCTVHYCNRSYEGELDERKKQDAKGAIR